MMGHTGDKKSPPIQETQWAAIAPSYESTGLLYDALEDKSDNRKPGKPDSARVLQARRMMRVGRRVHPKGPVRGTNPSLTSPAAK